MEAVAVLANIKGTVQSFVLGFLDIAWFEWEAYMGDTTSLGFRIKKACSTIFAPDALLVSAEGGAQACWRRITGLVGRRWIERKLAEEC